jgi:hypothetical protein
MIQIPADIQSFPAFLIPTTLLSKTSKRVSGKSSYAIAATFATAGLYHDAHPFAEEAKEEELEDATI